MWVLRTNEPRGNHSAIVTIIKNGRPIYLKNMPHIFIFKPLSESKALYMRIIYFKINQLHDWYGEVVIQ